MLTLSEAAKRTRRTRQAIRKAIETGRIRAERDDQGRWLVDEASLMAVYQLHQPLQEPDTQPVAGLQVEVAVLRTKLEATQRELDARERELHARDEALRRAEGRVDDLLADLRAANARLEDLRERQQPEPYQAPEPWPEPEPARPWWRRWFGR